MCLASIVVAEPSEQENVSLKRLVGSVSEKKEQDNVPVVSRSTKTVKVEKPVAKQETISCTTQRRDFAKALEEREGEQTILLLGKISTSKNVSPLCRAHNATLQWVSPNDGLAIATVSKESSLGFIEACLAAGYHVELDDTNCAQKGVF